MSKKSIPHGQLLAELLGQFRSIDFKRLAFPEIEGLQAKLKTLNNESREANEIRNKLSKIKLQAKHYIILSVENTLELAERNKWSLCKNHDFIYLYNGTFWKDIEKETFQQFLGEAAEKQGVKKFDARFFSFRESLFKQFVVSAYLPTPEPDPGEVLINLLNGTFEVSATGTRLRAFDPSDFLTYQLPFAYIPGATAPIFEAYLNRVLPDSERQQVLAEYLGFVFIKHGCNSLKEEKALILYGTGANGKSVFFEVVNALLGSDNVSSYSLQSLTNENGYFRAKMANKLVNYASEINGNLEASTFKQLVSGEPVEARLPYGQPFMLKHYAKLIFNCNELPKDVEHTNAYFRRFLIVPFDVTIPEHEQDKQLHSKIIENELSGVFNWVLEGLTRLLEQKHFSICEAARLAVEQYRAESNSVKLFLDETGYQSSPNDYRLIKELYPEYRGFCVSDGMKPFSKRNFIKQLKDMAIMQGRQPGTGQNVAYVSNINEPF
jgi:putative DNA primase/helicase